MKRARLFVINSLIMMLTTAILQSITMVFNIYVSERIGAEGMGLFSLIMSVNGLMMTVSTGGIHIATVRLVSEAQGTGKGGQISGILIRCTAFALICGTATGAVALLCSGLIGNSLLSDPRTVGSIRLLALTQPLNAFSAVMSGYFGAQRQIFKTAAVQLVDEIITVVAVTLGLKLMLPRGIEYSCMAIIFGNSLAHLISAILSAVLLAADARRYRGGGELSGITRRMLGIAMPVAVTSYAKSGLSTVKNLLIPYCLRLAGNSEQVALEQYGMLQGMAFPVVMIPQIVIASVSGLIVPEITRSRAAGKHNNVRYIISRAFHGVSIFAMCACGILVTYSRRIGSMIYSNGAVSEYIMWLALLIPVLYMDSVVDAALSGLDEQVNAMRISILDSVISIVLVLILLPRLGIMGYMITLYVCKIFNYSLSLFRLIRSSGLKLDVMGWIVLPLLSVLVALMAVKLLARLASVDTVFSTVVEIVSVVYIYSVLLRVTGCVGKSDIIWLKGLLVGTNSKFIAEKQRKMKKI